MKFVLRALFFHLLCIVIFTYLYKYVAVKFSYDKDKYDTISFVDFLTLSTTIQAGLGFSDLYPLTHTGKIILMVQQFIVISANVLTIYIFTI
jgi:hypothetical protein